ncbi:ATP-binding protein [Aquimarina sp. ERC-38]|uniref:ATP-dependent nuclease n=1 Tax=Aquimarina sp. ERC-38 TaxID=2949996 RepID=UPI0022477E1E|nr:AAA family ATPase [Aquimarina sp. ERC-38]UZO81324.1 ATP-binding protein [Aquimarina sp. ERC-38]
MAATKTTLQKEKQMIKVWLNEIQFSDDSKILIEENDIVVLVGPNNSGKSATLKETAQMLQQKNNSGKVVKDISFEKSSDKDQLISFLNEFSQKIIDTNPLPTYQGFGFYIYESAAQSYWDNSTNGLFDLVSIFVNSLSTEKRLSAANPPQSIKTTSEPPKHPIHFLQKNDSLEQKFNNYFKQAFGADLIVHRNAGKEVPLYVGKKPIPKEGEDRVSEGYLKKLEKLDLLHQQGDGMRSFVGVLLNAFISNHSILFIDEPEAFLHPPQARLLGKMIAKDLPSERQLFLATHSEDFLKGLLDSNIQNLKIIRIQRKDSINEVSVLNSLDINEIWSDSLLRHSNVLGGLFHSKVVICESDSDCRFFSAILSSLYDDLGAIAPDVLFIHCGGKHRVPTVIKALKKLNVPMSIVTDFDVLNNINPIKTIYENLGGTWDEVVNDWTLVKTEIERKRPEFLTDDLKDKIKGVFDSTSDRIFPKEKISEINRALKKASPWTEAKQVGKAYIPSGNATQAFERIQIKFKEKGFHILEVGELECFDKSIGNHGPKWVNEVLTKDLKTDSELENARKFVNEII